MKPLQPIEPIIAQQDTLIKAVSVLPFICVEHLAKLLVATDVQIGWGALEIVWRRESLCLTATFNGSEHYFDIKDSRL